MFAGCPITCSKLEHACPLALAHFRFYARLSTNNSTKSFTRPSDATPSGLQKLSAGIMADHIEQTADADVTDDCHQIFTLPEVLEMVLLGLPMKDLLLDQRVCKTWRNLITTSSKLQQALFLKPAGDGPVAWIDSYYDYEGRYHVKEDQTGLILGPALPDGFYVLSEHWGKTRTDAGRYEVFVNPLFKWCLPTSRPGSFFPLPDGIRESTAHGTW